jgi:hypothetical protein
VDAIVGDESDDEIEATDLGETDYASLFETAGWETEQT